MYYKDWMTMQEMRDELDKAHSSQANWVALAIASTVVALVLMFTSFFVPEPWATVALVLTVTDMVLYSAVVYRKINFWGARAKELHLKINQVAP